MNLIFFRSAECLIVFSEYSEGNLNPFKADVLMTEIPIQELFQKNNFGKGKATEALSRTPKMRTKSFKGVLFVNFSV